MSQQSRGTPIVKQESFNHVNPQMVFQQQRQQQPQPQQQQQQRPPQPQQQQQQQPQQQSRPTPMMFMQPNSSSALQHQYINDDSLAGSSTFADNELAESLGGYGNLGLDPFTYTTNGNGFDTTSFDPTDQNGINHRGGASATGGKSYPLRLPPGTNQLYAASPSDFASFSPEFGSPVPAPIPFNRSGRPGQMTSMSMPQFGGNNPLHNHAAIMIGAGSLTASPSTPGFVGSFGNYGDLDIGDAAKQQALKEKRQKRRESHNAVERRRRDNINEKIQELAAIIPDEFMTPASQIHGASSPLSASPATHHAPDGTIKHNKGVILRKSVDYIRSLQDVVKEAQRRARRLEEEVKRLGGDPRFADEEISRRESMSQVEDEENWLEDSLIGDDSPGMMMD